MTTIFTVTQINEQINDPADWAAPFFYSYKSFAAAQAEVSIVMDALIEDNELPDQLPVWWIIGNDSVSTAPNQWKLEIVDGTVYSEELEPVYSFIVTKTLVKE